MKIITVLLLAILSGCANTPYRAAYTKASIDPAAHNQDRSQCKKQAWNDAVIADGGQYSGDVFLLFVQRNMLSCMKAKGYDPIGIHPNAYKQAF